MNTVTLHYTATAWGTGFSLEAPTSTGPSNADGYFEPGEYWSAAYALPEGFEIAESTAGTREFFRGGEQYALTHKGTTPFVTNGHDDIYLKKVA